MNIKKRLATLIHPGGRLPKKITVAFVVMACMLLSGFSTWNVVFSSIVNFPPGEAVNLELVENFGSIANPADLEAYLGGDIIAEEIITGMMANLSGNVYYNIEMAEMHDEPIGLRIVRIILDRLFS